MIPFLPPTVLFGWSAYVAAGGTGVVPWLAVFGVALSFTLWRALPRYWGLR